MLVFVRLALLCFAFWGLCYGILLQHKIPFEFMPAIIGASISSLMIVAGLLNCFKLMICFVILAGAISAVWSIIRIVNNGIFTTIKSRNFTVLCIWCLLLLYFAILVKGAHFVHYDNFSHWALVVKEMLASNRMPNFQDSIIMFKSYPLGSAVFVYFVCKVIGCNAEWLQMLAQIVLLVSFLLPIVAFVNKKNIHISIIVPVFVAFSFVFIISIYDLLVDTLMPLAGIALISFLIYSDGETTLDVKCAVVFSLPLFFFLIHVKNSGIYFALIGWIYLYFTFRKKEITVKAKRLFALVDICIPLLSLYLWKKHVDFVFANGNMAKHSMSLANYSQIFAQKTKDDFISIFIEMMSHMMDLSQKYNQVLLCIVLIMICTFFAAKYLRVDTKGILLSGLSMLAIFIVYFAFVYAMYVFSMPLGEALKVAGFSRYISTVVLYLYGLCVICVLRVYPEINPNRFAALMCVILCFCPLFLMRTSLNVFVTKQDYESTDRYKIQQLLSRVNVTDNRAYAIYNEHDAGYLYYVTRYETGSNLVSKFGPSDFIQNVYKLETYDYLIIWTQDEIVRGYLQENGLAEYISDTPVIVSLANR